MASTSGNLKEYSDRGPVASKATQATASAYLMSALGYMKWSISAPGSMLNNIFWFQLENRFYLTASEIGIIRLML